MSISAKDVNILIARHLQESSFSHTAYIFRNEAMVEDEKIDLPPQALITILQKGMLYMQLEKAINNGAKNEQSPEEIINNLVETAHQQEPPQHTKQPPRPKPVHHLQQQAPPPAPVPAQIQPAPPQPAPAPVPEKIEVTEVPCNKCSLYYNHKAEVFCGAWTNDGKYFASASNDATAIIWECHNQQFTNPIVLDHATSQESSSHDHGVVSLVWNSTSTLLATGCCDGTVRLWTNKGTLKFLLGYHTSSIYALQFSPDDNFLLTCSQDTKVIVWDVARGQQKQIFQFHKERALDIDWYDNNTFASGSGDWTIVICKIGNSRPLLTLPGHENDVNKISWDPTKKYLASCSDDKTVRVWRPFDKNGDCTVFRGHTASVYTIKWMPGVDSPRQLASGSFDHKVRIWDVPNKQCIAVIDWKHEVFSIAYAPSGKYFAVGGVSTELGVYRSKGPELIGVYSTDDKDTKPGGIFEAAWSPSGDAIALCETNAVVALVPTSLFPNYVE